MIPVVGDVFSVEEIGAYVAKVVLEVVVTAAIVVVGTVLLDDSL